MALVLFISWLTFLLGFERGGSSDDVCLAVAVVLHYSILASFMWTLVEGLMQYRMLVRVMNAHVEHFLIKACLLGWGESWREVCVCVCVCVSEGDERPCGALLDQSLSAGLG